MPGINTTATNGTAGGTISDTARITGLASPVTSGPNAGTVTFQLFSGPGGANAVCNAGAGGNLVFDSGPQPINFGNVPPSATVSTTVNTAGPYHWVASFSGDANNRPATGVCGEAGENSVVSPNQPGINTTATNGTAGGTISDTAQITGLVNPVTGANAGTVTFRLYSGPGGGGAVCDGSLNGNLVFTSGAQPVNFNNTPPSATVSTTINTAGPYHWVATFSGDANNLPVTGVCGEAGENSVVAPNQPGINTTATNGTAGGTISDTAQITGLVNPVTGANAGTVTFRLYSGAGGANAVV